MSLELPGLPPFSHPDIAQFGYALLIGLLAAPVGLGVRRLALLLRPWVGRRRLIVSPVVGLAVAGLAALYATSTAHDATDVLFSGARCDESVAAEQRSTRSARCSCCCCCASAWRTGCR